MSRCELKGKNPNQTVAVGIDPTTRCWFFQLHDEKEEEKEDGNLGYVIDEDWLSKNKTLEKLLKYADTTDSYTQLVLSHIALDLDPGLIAKNDKLS